MNLKQIRWKTGLTKERRTELSDLLFDSGAVISKYHIGAPRSVPIGIAVGSLWLGSTLITYPGFNICIRSGRTMFELDNEQLFNALQVGDLVSIAYREVYTATYDYVPPNFDRKQFVGRALADYQLVNVQKKQ